MRIRIAFINKDGVEPCDLCPALDGGYDAGSVSDIDTIFNASFEQASNDAFVDKVVSFGELPTGC